MLNGLGQDERGPRVTPIGKAVGRCVCVGGKRRLQRLAAEICGGVKCAEGMVGGAILAKAMVATLPAAERKPDFLPFTGSALELVSTTSH